MEVTSQSKKVPATSTGGYNFERFSSKYRPYTLREYEEMKKVAAPKLGGLVRIILHKGTQSLF